MRWFKKEEMAQCFRENGARCKECPLKQRAGKLPDGIEDNLKALVEEVLNPARERLGRPIVVNDGYRCPLHNASVGGAPNSQHIHGEAADIRSSTGSVTTLGKIIEQLGNFDQLIYYPTFIHVSYKRLGRNRHQVLKKVPSGYQKV